jgi:transcriptional regulator
MLEQRVYALSDQAGIRTLIDQTGWATLVSGTSGDQLVVSHLPVILDPQSPDLAVLSHLPKAEIAAHEFGERDVVLIVQGPNGYVSPGWYEAEPSAPTWNFMVAHLHGRPELVDAAATYAILDATVDHFESARSDPWRLASVEDFAHRLAAGVAGFRLRPHRVVAKAKLSQDKPLPIIQRVIAALDSDPHYRNPGLADAMRRHPPGQGSQSPR